jgi:hypothetical protein
VLIVFSYLVIPAVIVALFTRDLTKRLFAGWGVGILASALGMYTSYTLDTPTGAAVVACFGGLLARGDRAEPIRRAFRQRRRAIGSSTNARRSDRKRQVLAPATSRGAVQPCYTSAWPRVRGWLRAIDR